MDERDHDGGNHDGLRQVSNSLDDHATAQMVKYPSLNGLCLTLVSQLISNFRQEHVNNSACKRVLGMYYREAQILHETVLHIGRLMLPIYLTLVVKDDSWLKCKCVWPS